MMILISGAPGNGKTLKALDIARREHDRNAEAVKAGKEKPRRFFTNIAGATLEENPKAFDWFERLPEDNDWTKLPDGSYVVYDEAHADGNTPELARYGVLFPGTGQPGESRDPRIRAMSTHRHRGFDLVFVTQWPSKVHHNVRQLVGEHIHMNRALGLQRAGTVKWTRVQPDPYDERARDKAEEEIWSFPGDLYDRYHSATLHTATYKFRIPGKLWSGLSVMVVVMLMVWGIWKWVQPSSDDEPKAQQAAQAEGRGAPGVPPAPVSVESLPVAPPTGIYTSLNATPTPRIVGYIDSPRGCRMWNDKGEQLDIAQDECVRMVAKGIPLHFLDAGGSKRERADKAPGQGAGQSPAAMGAAPPAPAPASGGASSFGSVAAYGKDGLGAY
ncbi:MAG: hypothetical protein J0L59_01680 [Xanthomonadales bacterium]|nr:hypothetical protein [Xanthomonadales bacterium]